MNKLEFDRSKLYDALAKLTRVYPRKEALFCMHACVVTDNKGIHQVDMAETYDPDHPQTSDFGEIPNGQGWVARFVLIHKKSLFPEGIKIDNVVNFYEDDLKNNGEKAIVKISICMAYLYIHVGAPQFTLADLFKPKESTLL